MRAASIFSFAFMPLLQRLSDPIVNGEDGQPDDDNGMQRPLAEAFDQRSRSGRTPSSRTACDAGRVGLATLERERGIPTMARKLVSAETGEQGLERQGEGSAGKSWSR